MKRDYCLWPDSSCWFEHGQTQGFESENFNTKKEICN